MEFVKTSDLLAEIRKLDLLITKGQDIHWIQLALDTFQRWDFKVAMKFCIS